jgi:hypothetical protein
MQALVWVDLSVNSVPELLCMSLRVRTWVNRLGCLGPIVCSCLAPHKNRCFWSVLRACFSEVASQPFFYLSSGPRAIGLSRCRQKTATPGPSSCFNLAIQAREARPPSASTSGPPACDLRGQGHLRTAQRVSQAIFPESGDQTVRRIQIKIESTLPRRPIGLSRFQGLQTESWRANSAHRSIGATAGVGVGMGAPMLYGRVPGPHYRYRGLRFPRLPGLLL